jgi:hypothetical protein
MSKHETATRAVVTVALILIGLALSVSGVKLGIGGLLLAVVFMLAAMAINRREWWPYGPHADPRSTKRDTGVRKIAVSRCAPGSRSRIRSHGDGVDKRYVFWWLLYLLLATCLPFSTSVVSQCAHYGPRRVTLFL